MNEPTDHDIFAATNALTLPRAQRQPTRAPVLAEPRLDVRASLISLRVLVTTLRLAEALALIGVGFAIVALYVGATALTENMAYIGAVTLTTLTALALFQMLGLYRREALLNVTPTLARLLVGWLLALFALVAVIFFLKTGINFSRVWLALWFSSGALVLAGGRLVLARAMHRWAQEGRLNRRAVIYGSGPECLTLIEALEAQPDNDIRICGLFDDRGPARVATQVGGYHRLGNGEDLVSYARSNRVDLLLVALPITAERRLLEILRQLWVLPLDIRLAAHASRLRFRPRAYSYIGRVPFIDIFDKPIADWGIVSKWLFDKVIASLALLLLSPLMIATAIAIRLDSAGPVLFRQKRYGFNNELIEVFKFRSMHTALSDANAVKLVTRDDPRVTRVGRFIRKTSLDELPQLFNVLQGTLSLVGPRPHALQAKAADQLYQDVVDGYFARHKVKPGITGWAQINGWRGETDTADKIQRRVEHDIHYIENWSVLLDLKILLKTPLSLLKGDNAY
ncbi:MAG: undecaprenyl-phosphate glucose phosphotransferase [Pseudomonadota bacterium]